MITSAIPRGRGHDLRRELERLEYISPGELKEFTTELSVETAHYLGTLSLSGRLRVLLHDASWTARPHDGTELEEQP